MAAELKERYGVDVELIKGARGAFEVSVGTETVFSKLQEDRFPEDEEIFDHFK